MQDEELLLAEDDVITKEDENKKRKSLSSLQSPNLKKQKTVTEKSKSDEMVEVKSASGKSMFVNKATLEKIMASRALQKPAAAKNINDDEKLLEENGKNKENTIQNKKILAADSMVFSPKKIRSHGK